ncbi:MAG TPA: fructose-6-phosphate aldolase [Puia sp.]|jgi:transaldolase|nr:fructose-6-phosphate aldolase [Puia sp.]
MKFFIDTADLAQIKEANDLGILDGVTTNPSLMAKVGIKGEAAVTNHYKTICEIVDGDISAEVVSTEFKDIIEEGKKLAAIHPNIIVKVPMIKDGVKAIKWFTDNGIKTNCTLVFSAGQAILAAKAGAAYVSPFIGRIDDSGWDGVQLIEQIANIYAIQGFETEILAASIRSALHIIQCAEAGADVVTSPLEPILGLLKHPLTDIGLAKFLADAKSFK